MVYVRGAASDYDDWAKLENEGWSTADLLPLMKKAETFTVAPDLPTHGYSGPTKISTGGCNRFAFAQQFLDVAKEYDPKTPQVLDNNDLSTSHAYSPWYKYIDPKTGRRSDAATNYLYPNADNPNLHILVAKRVKRVIVENGRAVGVEYLDDVISCPAGTTEVSIARASKLVVICGGAFGSPTILERSGIGSRAILEEKGVPVVMDLPGVGENYQDHYGVFQTYHASNDTVTLNPLWRGDVDAYNVSLKQWESDGKGPIASNGIDALLKIRPTPKELESMGPEFSARWESFFKNSPDKPVAAIVPLAGALGDPSAMPPGEIISSGFYIFYPDSVGSVHISSGEDANAPPDFYPGCLSGPSDLPLFSMLYKKTRELIRRLPCFRGEVVSDHPEFPEDSAAACKKTEGPVPINASDIVYTPDDDKAIAEYIRKKVQSTWHSLGTCAMKPRDQGGVVDARLNVYGVKSLKVADLSIAPENVGTVRRICCLRYHSRDH
ncbi:GMC oxidoreductase-domain-containing protein [Scleroderma yunnanense]